MAVVDISGSTIIIMQVVVVVVAIYVVWEMEGQV